MRLNFLSLGKPYHIADSLSCVKTGRLIVNQPYPPLLKSAHTTHTIYIDDLSGVVPSVVPVPVT